MIESSDKPAKLTALLVVLVATAATWAQTSITLRERVQLDDVAAVTIGDVARVRGTDSDRIGRVVVIKAEEIRPGTTTKVDVKDVRRVLSEVDGFNWGEVTIRGSRCDVVGPPQSEETKERRSKDEPTNAAREVSMVFASSIGVGTVRERVAATLAAYLKVDASLLKVGFREQDSGLLDQSVDEFAVEVRPMSVSGRIPVRVTLFDARGEKDGTTGVVRVHVRVRIETARAVRAIRRGSVIATEDVEVAQTWMEPGTAWATGAIAVGSSAIGTIEQGQFIRHAHVHEPMAVKRNELVSVRCVSGSVILRSRARATMDAKRGEVIELESLHRTRSERRRFMARITGPGQAVVIDEVALTIDKDTGAK